MIEASPTLRHDGVNKMKGKAMKPSRKRFWLYHGLMAAVLFVPFHFLPGLLEEPYWRDFFCHREWYSNWETMLQVLIFSVLLHYYWFSRRGAGEKGEALALTFIVLGLIVLPYFIISGAMGVYYPESGMDREILEGVWYGFLFYWPVMTLFIARLDCVWPEAEGNGRLSKGKRFFLLLALTCVSLLLTSVLVVMLGGPCWILSMP